MSQIEPAFRRAGEGHWGHIPYSGPTVSDVRAAVRPASLVSGAGPAARQLRGVYQRQLRPAVPTELGWQRPPARPIPVALAGRGEPDWHLDPDETAF